MDGPPLPNLRAGRYALCTRRAMVRWPRRANHPPRSCRSGAVCPSWRGAAAGVLAHLRLWGIGTRCCRSWGLSAASRRAFRPTYSPPEACPSGGGADPVRACRVGRGLPPGCHRAGADGSAPFEGPARDDFHALITHAGVRAAVSIRPPDPLLSCIRKPLPGAPDSNRPAA